MASASLGQVRSVSRIENLIQVQPTGRGPDAFWSAGEHLCLAESDADAAAVKHFQGVRFDSSSYSSRVITFSVSSCSASAFALSPYASTLGVKYPGRSCSDNRSMLVERTVDFAHGYRIKCDECLARNWLTAEQYVASPEAVTTCSTCHKQVNFGPAVIDLRDPFDVALSDSELSGLAWYHTTDEPDWPAVQKPLEESLVEHLKKQAYQSDEELERYRLIHEHQALHIGTYEAALESMLRRMSQQGAQHQKFFLYRVRLRQGLKIEPGWRNENYSPAAKITSTSLAEQGVDAIRYLNAHESIGSISLAVSRGAIKSTQRLPLPVQQLKVLPDPRLIEKFRAIRKAVSIVLDEHNRKQKENEEKEKARIREWGEKEVTQVERMRRAIFEAKKAPTVPHQVWDALREMGDLAAENHLKDLPVVCKKNFIESLQGPAIDGTNDSDLVWLEKFAGLAALLTHYDEVQRLLIHQPWRSVQVS